MKSMELQTEIHDQIASTLAQAFTLVGNFTRSYDDQPANFNANRCNFIACLIAAKALSDSALDVSLMCQEFSLVVVDKKYNEEGWAIDYAGRLYATGGEDSWDQIRLAVMSNYENSYFHRVMNTLTMDPHGDVNNTFQIRGFESQIAAAVEACRIQFQHRTLSHTTEVVQEPPVAARRMRL